MIRAVCCMALIGAALDSVIKAGGDRPGILAADWLWLHWLFALSLIAAAIRVAIWGTER